MLSVPILIRSYRVPHALIEFDSNLMNCTNFRENRPNSFLHTLLTAKKQLVPLSDINSYKLSFLFSPIPRSEQDVLCFLCAGYSSYWSATTINYSTFHTFACKFSRGFWLGPRPTNFSKISNLGIYNARDKNDFNPLLGKVFKSCQVKSIFETSCKRPLKVWNFLLILTSRKRPLHR